MRMITAFSGPCAPDALTSRVSVFSHYFRRLGRLTKLATSSKVLIPDSATKRYRHKVREALAPSTHKESTNAKIRALNRLTNGWCQYYRITSSPTNVFNQLRAELFWDMAHWLGRKWELSMPNVMRKYRKGNTFGTNSETSVMPTDHKAKRLLTKTWHNPYTAKEAVIRERLIVMESLWSGYERRHGGMDLREEVIAHKGTMCAMNGPDCESRGISWLRVFRSVDIARLGSGRRPQHHMRRGEEKNAWNSEPERGAGMR